MKLVTWHVSKLRNGGKISLCNGRVLDRQLGRSVRASEIVGSFQQATFFEDRLNSRSRRTEPNLLQRN